MKYRIKVYNTATTEYVATRTCASMEEAKPFLKSYGVTSGNLHHHTHLSHYYHFGNAFRYVLYKDELRITIDRLGSNRNIKQTTKNNTMKNTKGYLNNNLISLIWGIVGTAITIAVVWGLCLLLTQGSHTVRAERVEFEKVRKDTYHQWIEEMGYDFTYSTYKELRSYEQLPTSPKNQTK